MVAGEAVEIPSFDGKIVPAFLHRPVGEGPFPAIIDVHGLTILDPVTMESTIRAMVGVVTVGLFALRGADVILLGSDTGVNSIVVRRPL